MGILFEGTLQLMAIFKVVRIAELQLELWMERVDGERGRSFWFQSETATAASFNLLSFSSVSLLISPLFDISPLPRCCHPKEEGSKRRQWNCWYAFWSCATPFILFLLPLFPGQNFSQTFLQRLFSSLSLSFSSSLSITHWILFLFLFLCKILFLPSFLPYFFLFDYLIPDRKGWNERVNEGRKSFNLFRLKREQLSCPKMWKSSSLSHFRINFSYLLFLPFFPSKMKATLFKRERHEKERITGENSTFASASFRHTISSLKMVHTLISLQL